MPFPALMVAVVVAIVIIISSHDADPGPDDPSSGASVAIAALGDSYISGEGAERYLAGTDDPGTNECRRARTAYPHVVARELRASLRFAACSGARTHHVISIGQFPESPGTVLGARPQIKALDDVPRLRAVLLGIGGNNAGFGEIGRSCALPFAPDCRRSAQAWIDRLETAVFPALVETYRAVRAAAGPADVIALTYPNPIGPESCNDIALNEAELSFVRDVFIVRLNEIVGAAARAAGVRLIDLEPALAGHRLCEVPLRRAAVNFLHVGRTRGARLNLGLRGLVGLGHGTFHPNAHGHALMARHVRDTLESLLEGGLPPAPAPRPGTRPPPFRPEELGAANGPYPFPNGAPCVGDEVAVVTPIELERGVRRVTVRGTRPRSTVCFRGYRERWRSRRADVRGVARVPIDVRSVGIGSINEVLVQQRNGAWHRIVVSRQP